MRENRTRWNGTRRRVYLYFTPVSPIEIPPARILHIGRYNDHRVTFTSCYVTIPAWNVHSAVGCWLFFVYSSMVFLSLYLFFSLSGFGDFSFFSQWNSRHGWLIRPVANLGTTDFSFFFFFVIPLLCSVSFVRHNIWYIFGECLIAGSGIRVRLDCAFLLQTCIRVCEWAMEYRK